MRLLAILTLLLPYLANANISQLAQSCQKQLQTSQQKLPQLTQCQHLLKQANSNNSEPLFIYGHLLVTSQHQHNNSYRKKRGLFYWVLAADQNNISAIKYLSEFVKQQMIDGKIPIKYAHYLSYLEQDWQLKGKDPQHHYAQYQQWLNLVEQSQSQPHKLANKILVDIATAFENGYFLGQSNHNALKLYQIAAARNDTKALYKAGELTYNTDQTTALKYLQQAAKQQSGDAMLKLGDHFACKGDKQQGENWYKQAIQTGNQYAEEELETLQNTGKPTQC